MSPARFALSPSEVVSWDPILRHYLTADPLIFGAVHELRALVVESACICMRSPNRRRDRTIFPTLGAGSVVWGHSALPPGVRDIRPDRTFCYGSEGVALGGSAAGLTIVCGAVAGSSRARSAAECR